MSPITNNQNRIAVLLPCFNEEKCIAQVIKDFQTALPHAHIYVYDNNSSDQTIAVATNAGAIVRKEKRQGKGYVMQRMLADIEADIYVLADGDDTYDAAAAPALIQQLQDHQLDMVIGSRRSTYHESNSRQLHKFGNHSITWLLNTLFGSSLQDILSGYRVMSRSFVKSLPLDSRGFEAETRLTVLALELGASILEVETKYKERPAGSESKLRTFSDGWKILRTILYLFKEAKPLPFFMLLSLLLALLSLVLGFPVLQEFLQTHRVDRFPTAILAASIGVLSALSITSGFILDSVKNSRLETRRLFYLLHKSME